MKKSIKLLCIVLSFILSIGLAGCGKDKAPETDQNVEGIGIKNAIITVENYGDIHLELDGDTAPITVANFVKLAKEGFYDGITFHRIIENFMIQGGDPKADGTGGSKETIKGEFSSNGVTNNISHTRGTISMARLGNDPNSASSQFFIVHKDSTYLDGQYAAFGRVTQGMDVVDRIATKIKPVDAMSGLVEKANQPRITTIKIVE